MVIYFLRNILPQPRHTVRHPHQPRRCRRHSQLPHRRERVQGVAVAHDADGCRRAGLYGYHHGVVGQEATCVAAELLEAFGQTAGDERGQPEVQGRSNQAGGVRRLGQVGTEAAVHEVGHTLRRRRLTTVTLLPAEALKVFLKGKHI